MNLDSRAILSISSRALLGTFLMTASVGLVACGEDDMPGDMPDDMPPGTDNCLAELLPLQNLDAFPLGETFYLPRIQTGDACSADLAWAVLEAPADSRNQIYAQGAPEPRFTPDIAGTYRFHVPGVSDSEVSLQVVALSAKERFRNHYLTPLYGAALVGDELWTANGPSYTVTRLTRASGTDSWSKVDDVVVGSWPAAVAWRESLSYGVVALRGSDTVGFIDRTRGVLEDALWVGDEPSGLAISPDASQLYVSLATMRQVAVVDLAQREVVDHIDVGFDPRAVAISPDGERLFVASYRSGNRATDTFGNYGSGDDEDIWIIDTSTLQVTEAIAGISADLRAIAMAEDGSELYIAATDGNPVPSMSAEDSVSFIHQAIVLGADPDQSGYGQVLREADLTRQESAQEQPVVNPAGIVRSGDTLWVASESSSLIVGLDAKTLEEQVRVPVGHGARQLVALDNGAVAVHCYQSFELWIVTAAGEVSQTVTLTDDPRAPEIALGERVFTRPGNNFATNHACSSCHIESQNDGMVWIFGPELWHNVRPLQLLDATTPIEWGAYVSSTENFGYQGPSSIMSRPATPEEAVGLQTFLGSLIGAPRATGHTRVDGSYTAAGLRGQALFEGKAVCSGCHTPPLYTSREFIATGKSGIPADVPTLLGAYRHGVYMVEGQARSLEDAVDIAISYVGVDLTADERGDLLAFLYQLTPKGSAPLGMWPDLGTNEGVYPNIEPWVAFADPVTGVDGKSAAETAAQYVVLEDANGTPVPSSVAVADNRVVLTPNAALTAGATYRFRVRAGLPFASGGALVAERRSEFTVAKPAQGTLAASMLMNVTLMGPGGPSQVPFLLDEITPGNDGLQLILKPQAAGTQQRQSLWARIDGDRFLLEPFAMPLPGGNGVADAADVVGTIQEVDGQNQIVSITGTLLIQGPGIEIPGVPFEINQTAAIE